jgi:hypothetical protein
MTHVYDARGFGRALETVGAWVLGLLWILPLAFAIWTAVHPGEYSTRFVLTAPLTFANFIAAWNAAPFARYFVNTVLARRADPRRAARAGDARRIRVRALRVSRGAACCSRWC